MISVVEDICYTRVRVLIGRGTISVLNNEIDGKALVVRQKSIPYTMIANIVKEGKVLELVLEGGEQDKDIDVVFKIVDLLYANGFQRRDSVIAIGGGTLIDVVGFAASIYMRGLKLVIVPTTLLGMVDAAIGGKNAVNFRGVKNVLGTFYQPSTIVIDIDFLDTLPNHEFVNGLAEVIKYGIVLDRDLFEYLKNNVINILSRDDKALEHIIHRSVLNKLSIVKEDPYELKDVRIVLNFGHTIGHALEAASRFRVPHGKAVAVGMILETELGVTIGVTPRYCLNEVRDLVRRYGLPTTLDDLGVEMDWGAAKAALLKDKKARGDAIAMPLPNDIGSWVKHYVPIKQLMEVISKWIG